MARGSRCKGRSESCRLYFLRTELTCSGSGSVDFQEFVGGLSAFSSKGGREEKLRCECQRQAGEKGQPARTLTIVAFKVYDMDRDGYISNGELYLVLKQMVGNNLKVRRGASRRVEASDCCRTALVDVQDQQLQQIVDKTIMEADKDGCVECGAWSAERGRVVWIMLTPATASCPSRSLRIWSQVRTLSSERSS